MTSTDPARVRVSVDLAMDPAAAFRALVDELVAALDRRGMRFEPGPGGRLSEGSAEVGRVVAWEDRRIALEWRQASWEPGEVTRVELRVEPVGDGALLTVEHHDWGRLVGASEELVGWFASEVVAPFLAATGPRALGDWITDRRARRPSGPEYRAVYRDPLYHYPGFRVLLSELALTPADHLIEVGSGGGALLKEALESGCRAAGVDHSPDMVRVAREANPEAIADGRLEILRASADRLPFADGVFTCATMTGVLGFLADPVAALAEIRRVLTGTGRLVVAGSDPELRGTPGAPEPMASRLRFYHDAELEAIARSAGFGSVRAVRRDLEPFAREVGIPEEHVPLFAGPGSRFLLASVAADPVAPAVVDS